MANSFIKPTVVASTALGLLQREIILPSLVWRDAVQDFAGAYNDTVSIRVPATTSAKTRALRGTGTARDLTMSSLTETKVDVTLDTDVYNGIPVTDEELTLDVQNFGAQVLAPQIRAVGEELENQLAATMSGATYNTTVTFDDTAPYGSVVDARKALNDANVPFANRALVVGSGIEAAILKDSLFVQADQSGSTSALRDAQIGRIAGFDVYISNAIDENEAYAFHKTAYIMATRSPKVPDGAPFGSSQSFQGIALRWLRDYDFASTTDRSLVDTFCGFEIVKDDSKFVRAVKLTYTPETP